MAEWSLNGLKTLCEKEKLLVSSNFFSHSVFKRLVLQTRKNQGLFGKGLREIRKINSLPNDNTYDSSKLKAFTDDKINVGENLKFVLGRVENIVGKGDNAGYQHFLLFPQFFQKPSFSRS